MDWNLAIALFGALFLGFALVLGRSKTVLLMLSIYVARAIASEAGLLVSTVVEKVQENISLFIVKAVLFALVSLFILLKAEWGSDPSVPERGTTSTIMTILYAVLSYGLIVVSIASFLPEENLDQFLGSSQIVAKAFEYQLWWLIAPIFVMVTASFFRKPTGR